VGESFVDALREASLSAPLSAWMTVTAAGSVVDRAGRNVATAESLSASNERSYGEGR
jgi:hypothetical protein